MLKVHSYTGNILYPGSLLYQKRVLVTGIKHFHCAKFMIQF